MKSYPVTQGELWGLGAAGFLATLGFSAGTALVGFYFDTIKDLELAENAPPDAVAHWSRMSDFALSGSLFCYFLGFLFLIGGAVGVVNIRRRTTFEE